MKDASYHNHHGHNNEPYNVSKKIIRADILIMIFLFIFSIAVRLPAINYPLSGDAVIYAELAKNLYQEQSYAINGIFHTVYPFLFSLLTVPFMLFTNHLIALKLASFFWSSLAVILLYLIARKLAFDKKLALITALLLLFNPWFFYFTSTFPLSESLVTVLILLAYFTYDFNNSSKSQLFSTLLSALFFALAILTRYTAAIFLIPIIIVKIFQIIKAKNIKNNSLFLIISILPPFLWIIFSILNTEKFASHSYFGIFINQSQITISLLINNIINVGIIAPFILLIASSLFFLLSLSYFLIYKNMDKEGYFIKSKLWHYFLASYLFNIFISVIWFSLYPANFINIWEQLRFFVPFLPFMILFSMLSVNIVYKKYKMALNKVFTIIFIVILLISIIATFYLNYGFVKDITDKKFTVRELFVQKAYHQYQAINLINKELENNYIANSNPILILLSMQTIRDRQDVQFKYYFDNTLVYFINNNNINNKFNQLQNKQQLSVPSFLTGYYVYSEYSLQETEQLLKNNNIQFTSISLLQSYGRISRINVFKII